LSYEAQDIASRLREARENRGFSQRELARRSGVPQSHISKIEANAVDLRVSSLAVLAHALDLELTLIPRRAAPAVRSIVRSLTAPTPDEASRPAYSLDDEDEGDA
jgi:transcriptional regulator with XRE-family HTH domain